MDLVISKKEELQDLINEAVKNAMSAFSPKAIEKKEPMYLSVPEAVTYLNSIGIQIGKSQFYKYTMNKEVKFKVFGKKLLFMKEDLQAWAESKLKTNDCEEITEAVANGIEQKNNKQKTTNSKLRIKFV